VSPAEREVILNGKRFRPYIHKEEIEQIIGSLAEKINADYKGADLVILGVLDGVILFLADLIRQLNMNVTLELIKLKSYTGTSSSGEVKEMIGITSNLNGKKVLIVEDIIDTGHTLTHLLKKMGNLETESIEIVTLLLKEEVFKEKFKIKYVGKKIENKFVVGFGMDMDGAGRQIPEIYIAIE
jgi:hypoxanthine phosphoribosyltransferase